MRLSLLYGFAGDLIAAFRMVATPPNLEIA